MNDNVYSIMLESGGYLNIEMPSYQYRVPHDKTGGGWNAPRTWLAQIQHCQYGPMSSHS